MTLGLMKQIALLILLLISTEVFGEDSIVLGRGISNEYISDLPCPQGFICLDSMYLWEFAAKRTVVGPAVKGKVRFLAEQHTEALPKYVRSVELFILRPIEDKSVVESTGAHYYLLSLSPRYDNGTFCVSVDPLEAGLKLARSDVTVDPDSGYHCFKANRL